MNQRTIKVLLTCIEENDVLKFSISDTESIDVNLNSASCQAEIKKLFSRILMIGIEEDIVFNFCIEKDYKRGLYIDVCTEYMKDMQRELTDCVQRIRIELQG